jgi:hypothetical protein
MARAQNAVLVIDDHPAMAAPLWPQLGWIQCGRRKQVAKVNRHFVCIRLCV